MFFVISSLFFVLVLLLLYCQLTESGTNWFLSIPYLWLRKSNIYQINVMWKLNILMLSWYKNYETFLNILRTKCPILLAAFFGTYCTSSCDWLFRELYDVTSQLRISWLPVKKRITFKIMVYAYKCIHGLAPPYLSSLLRLYHPARSGLRSASDSSRLYEHNTKHLLTTSSNQTFSIVVPQVWNSIDISIRNSPSLVTFKKSLKTMLFQY